MTGSGDCDKFECPDGKCADSKFDCEASQCVDSYQYCSIAKMCIQKMIEYCVACVNMTSPYRCHSGQCVSKTALCNDTHECADGSDEWGYECKSEGRGIVIPQWLFQAVFPIIGLAIAIPIIIFRRKRAMRLRAQLNQAGGCGTTLAPGAVNTGNVPPPPPGMQPGGVMPNTVTPGAPPSYDAAMQSSKPNNQNSRSFSNFFSSGQGSKSKSKHGSAPQPPSYSQATASYPTQQAYSTPSSGTQPQQTNYNTQYGLDGQQSAFSYNSAFNYS